MANKILHILSDGKRYSGEILAEKLGMSRAGVWKQIQQLKNLGLDIDTKKYNGYQLKQKLDLLDKQKITNEISNKNTHLVSDIEIFQKIDSTNTYLINLSKNAKDIHGKAVLAELQTAGKGRRGKVWQSPFSNNIYLSLGWRFRTSCSAIEGLSLATGVVIAEVLRANGIDGVGLKWPNDIYLKDGKLGGILIEIYGDCTGDFVAVIGIGLNFYLSQQNKDLITDKKVCCIADARADLDRNTIAGQILNALLAMLANYETTGFSVWQAKWNALHAFKNAQVQVEKGDIKTPAKIGDVDNNGALEVFYNNGTKEFLQAGEISIKLD